MCCCLFVFVQIPINGKTPSIPSIDFKHPYEIKQFQKAHVRYLKIKRKN